MTDRENSGAHNVATYFISNMDCANEEKLIREGLARIAGVEQLEFDLPKRRLRVTHTLPTDESLVIGLKALGMRPARVGPAG